MFLFDEMNVNINVITSELQLASACVCTRISPFDNLLGSEAFAFLVANSVIDESAISPLVQHLNPFFIC
jgi:hypothetical protein